MTAADPRQELERTGEFAGGSENFSSEVGGLVKKNLDCTAGRQEKESIMGVRY